MFRAWEGVLRAGLASPTPLPSPVTVLTVHDTVWREEIQSPQDPLTSDPTFQRQVSLGCNMFRYLEVQLCF